MNRKNFLSSLFIAGAAMPLSSVQSAEGQQDKPIIIPPYLKYGDTIGITCPAGNITEKEIQSAMQQMENWGFKTRLGATVGKKDFIFGGTDQERIMDFQQMIDDNSISAIMCGRGGYGTIRIIDSIDFAKFADAPKWIIGFSDITLVLAHVFMNLNIASVHSKMCNSFPDDWSKAEPAQIDAIISIKQILTGQKMKYAVKPNRNNVSGITEGRLIGGNLKTIESMQGSKSELSTIGKILFLEDTGEYLYSIDRMFWNLKRSGKLSRLKGLIIGDFKIKPDDAGEEFGQTVYDIVLNKVKEFGYPVCFDFPVGHQKENYAIKHGASHRLTVNDSGCNLAEI
jgi:muramoyltetrapeptide carboxypeptidase